VIREAALSDLPGIVEVYNAAIPGRLATADLAPVSVDSRRAWFDAHTPAKRPMWVLHEDGIIAGWASLQSFYGRAAYDSTAEFSIYVANEYRRRGFGRSLMQHVVDRCPSLAIENLVGFVFAHNIPSLTLCEAFGFERWGHLPRVARLDGVERDLIVVGRRL
jgi:L-amino acid N-acyltransferase YncA